MDDEGKRWRGKVAETHSGEKIFFFFFYKKREVLACVEAEESSGIE